MGLCRVGSFERIFELHEHETPQTPLTATMVVDVFNPINDFGSKLFTGSPSVPFQHVLLRQREERFHRRVVSRGRHPAHRAREVVCGQHRPKSPGPELAAAVGVDNHSAD